MGTDNPLIVPIPDSARGKLALAMEQMKTAPNLLTEANLATEAAIEGQLVSGHESGKLCADLGKFNH